MDVDITKLITNASYMKYPNANNGANPRIPATDAIRTNIITRPLTLAQNIVFIFDGHLMANPLRLILESTLFSC